MRPDRTEFLDDPDVVRRAIEEVERAKAASTATAPLAPVTPKTMLEYALDCQRRGWFVFPCYPRKKAPGGEVVPHGVKEASNDEAVIRAWWGKNQNYNPAIALGPSNLVVYDFDEIKPFENIPATFTVKTGRIEKNGIAGIQMYYTGSCATHGHPNGGGEVRGRGAYVMAPGAVHPSGNPYVIIDDRPLAPSPEQNEEVKKPVGLAIGTDEQMTIASYVEDAFDVSGIDYQTRAEHEGGFKWFIACPWKAEHTTGKDFDTSTAVIMWPSGKLIYECKHSHCQGIRQWKELRGWMEKEAGCWLVFGEPSNEPVLFGGKPSSALTTSFIEEKHGPILPILPAPLDPSLADGISLLVFEDPKNVMLAGEASFDAAFAERAMAWATFDAMTAERAIESLDVLQKYDRVVLFGTSNKWASIKQKIDHAIQIDLPMAVNEDSLKRILSLDAIRLVNKKNPSKKWVLVPSGVQVREVEEPIKIDNPLVMPDSAMASTVLGDLYAERFAPNGFPMGIALPALVTAASVRVPLPPPDVPLEAQQPAPLIIQGDDMMVNLYTALIAEVHGGKSQAIEWACKALNIYQQERGPYYLEGKFGSTEMMLRYLKKNLSGLKENILINPDEWAYLFSKSDIPNASFPTFMTTSYYRRKQTFQVGNKVGEVRLKNALSFIAGIVEKDFDSVFGAGTLGGVYDRFLLGWSEGWMWDYQPYPYEVTLKDFTWAPVPVRQDGSVFEVIASWNKRSRRMGRVVEICTRIATIYASMDGRPVLYGQDLERLSGLAENQAALRTKFHPNEGINPDAQFANAVVNWLISKTKGEWVNISTVKDGVHAYERKLGPNVAERALAAMARGERIDVWLPKRDRDGSENQMPAEWKGRRPRIGLVRLRQS